MEGEEQLFKEQNTPNREDAADFFIDGQLNRPLVGVAGSGRNLREKINSVLIAIVALFAVFLGYYQLSFNIGHPFSFLETNNSSAACPGGNCDLKNQLALLAEQNQDSDEDGLTDQTEISVYRSSPFIADSDSDGISDSDEVKAGSDPNCPAGQYCAASQGAASYNTVTVPTLTQNPVISPTNITPANIRQMLKQNGFSDSEIGLYSDAELLAIFQEAVASESSMAKAAGEAGLAVADKQTTTAPVATIKNSTLSSSSAALNIKSVSDLKNLTGAQIRQLMIQNGAPEQILAQVSDEELKKVFLEKLSQNSSTTLQVK